MFTNSESDSKVFKNICKGVVNYLGSDTLIPVSNVEEQYNINLLQLVLKKKRNCIFSAKHYYVPSVYELHDVLNGNWEVSSDELVLTENCKFSENTRFKVATSNNSNEISSEIKNDGKTTTELGQLMKKEVKIPQLIEAFSTRTVNLEHDCIKQAKRNKDNVLCVVTGIVHPASRAHITRNTVSDATAHMHHIVSPSVSTERNLELTLGNRALAYNVNELIVNLEDGSIQMIVDSELHGGFLN